MHSSFKAGPEGSAGLDVGLIHPVPHCHVGGLQVVHIAVGSQTGFPLQRAPDDEVEGIQVWRGQWPHISHPKLAHVVWQPLLCRPGLVCWRRALLPHIFDPLELQIQPGFDHCLQHLLILLGCDLQPFGEEIQSSLDLTNLNLTINLKLTIFLLLITGACCHQAQREAVHTGMHPAGQAEDPCRGPGWPEVQSLLQGEGTPAWGGSACLISQGSW